MLESIKQLITLKSIDNLINNQNYDLALKQLNLLIYNGFRPCESYFKRAKLCRKLLMTEEAYSDLTYLIKNYEDNLNVYKERMELNFEIQNFKEAMSDSSRILKEFPEDKNAQRIYFLSLIYLSKSEEGKNFILSVSGNNKYRAIQTLLNETALAISVDELAKALKILEIIDLMDKDNPIKLLKEASIYGLAGDENRQKEILRKIDSIFPKYFISHFKFGDIYEERDILEICFLLELKIFDKQNLFAYPMAILEGYKQNLEGHILDSKECFTKAIEINPEKPEAYVLLGQTFQLMSSYDNPQYKKEAEENYAKALKFYERDNLITKADAMKRQIKHLNSDIKIPTN